MYADMARVFRNLTRCAADVPERRDVSYLSHSPASCGPEGASLRGRAPIFKIVACKLQLPLQTSASTYNAAFMLRPVPAHDDLGFRFGALEYACSESSIQTLDRSIAAVTAVVGSSSLKYTVDCSLLTQNLQQLSNKA